MSGALTPNAPLRRIVWFVGLDITSLEAISVYPVSGYTDVFHAVTVQALFCFSKRLMEGLKRERDLIGSNLSSIKRMSVEWTPFSAVIRISVRQGLFLLPHGAALPCVAPMRAHRRLCLVEGRVG